MWKSFGYKRSDGKKSTIQYYVRSATTVTRKKGNKSNSPPQAEASHRVQGKPQILQGGLHNYCDFLTKTIFSAYCHIIKNVFITEMPQIIILGPWHPSLLQNQETAEPLLNSETT